MGQRDSRKRRRPGRRGPPGHHFERDSRGHQRLGLLAAAPEDEWIAALEAHHAPSGARTLDEYPVQLGLAYIATVTALLAGVNQLGIARRERQQLGTDQIIVDHHLCATQDLFAAYSNQIGSAGPRPDQVDPARALTHRRQTRPRRSTGAHRLQASAAPAACPFWRRAPAECRARRRSSYP